jgi:hypothetical protein
LSAATNIAKKKKKVPTKIARVTTSKIKKLNSNKHAKENKLKHEKCHSHTQSSQMV